MTHPRPIDDCNAFPIPDAPVVLREEGGFHLEILPEGVRVHRKIAALRRQAEDALQGPLLPEGRELTEADADRVREFLLETFPPDGDNYRPHLHMQLTGVVAAEIASRLGRNPHEFHAAGLLHDAGRFLNEPGKINGHRYFRNDLTEAHLHRVWKTPSSVLDKLQPNASFLWDAPRMEDLTPDQRVVVMADILGKREDDGRIRPIGATLEYHKASRDFTAEAIPPRPAREPGKWYSETLAKSVATPRVVEAWKQVYLDIAAWLEEQGVRIADVIAAIEAREEAVTPDTVIFDVGGVLIPDTDPAILADFRDTLGITDEQRAAAWADLIPGLSAGTLSEDAFWTRFGQRIGKGIPAEHRTLFSRKFDANVHPDMRALLRDLKHSGRPLAALSDTIPPHARSLRDAGAYDAFDRVLLSPEIGCSKNGGSPTQKDSPLAAFCVAALRMRRHPRACVFIDDKPAYIGKAEAAGMRGIVFTSVEGVRGDLAALGL